VPSKTQQAKFFAPEAVDLKEWRINLFSNSYKGRPKYTLFNSIDHLLTAAIANFQAQKTTIFNPWVQFLPQGRDFSLTLPCAPRLTTDFITNSQQF
jgi:hypothetical protein